VINLAISLRRSKASETSEHGPDEWDTTLYLPPNIVSPSEQSQITSRLQAWAEALEVGRVHLP
jgi:tRNA A64-2'-O-ribosylphosphate transferase